MALIWRMMQPWSMRTKTYRFSPKMKINLRKGQASALDRMHSGSILCGGVGSGKSRTSLAYFFTKECNGKLDEYKPPSKIKDLYIITTAKKRDSLEWEDELAVFLLSTNVEESVCNIKVKIDSWNNITKYKDVKDSFFIFDEQRVVGYGSWSKTFIKIAKMNNWILLSATPGDTWLDYMPVFIANGFYKNKTDFVKRHVVYKRFVKYPVVEKYINVEHLIRYRKRVLVKMASVKTTVPHRIRITTTFDKDSYQKIAKEQWDIFEQKPIKTKSSLLYLLRKVVNSDPSKIEQLKQLTKEHDRIIIFYNYTYELEMIRAAKFKNFTVAEWNGQKHENVPKSKKWLYLVQYTAGAEGWECTTTDTIVFFSQSYSYKMMTQAAGRIDRMNTPFKDLYYYYFVSESSIDYAVSAALSKKKNFNERAFKV